MNSLSKLAEIINADYQGDDLSYQGISINTRTIQSNEIFIAIKGEHFDGHDFLANAKKHGAIAAVVEIITDTDIPQLKVDNSKLALGKIAAHHRRQFTCPMIALTGSCGKTTVKEMIHSILSVNAPALATAGNFNNDIGVPLTLLRLTSEHQFAVLELAANHVGEIAYTTHLTKPDVALINTIQPAHLEGFGSIERIADAKSEIFQGLSSAGIAIINLDTPFTQVFTNAINGKSTYTFSLKQSADFTAENIVFDNCVRASFQLNTPKGNIHIQLQLAGEHNVANALAVSTA